MYNVTPYLFDKAMRTVVVHCGYFFFLKTVLPDDVLPSCTHR